MSRASERELTRLRRAAIGFVFQSFNLVDELTVAQNVELGLLYRGTRARERRERVARGARPGWHAASRPPSALVTVGRPAPYAWLSCARSCPTRA